MTHEDNDWNIEMVGDDEAEASDSVTAGPASDGAGSAAAGLSIDAGSDSGLTAGIGYSHAVRSLSWLLERVFCRLHILAFL